MCSVKTSQQIGHYHGCNPLLLLHLVCYSACFVTSQTPNCETKLSAIAHAAVLPFTTTSIWTRILILVVCSTVHKALFQYRYLAESSSSSDLYQLFCMGKHVQTIIMNFRKLRRTTSRKRISARVIRLHVAITYAIEASDIFTKYENVCLIEIRLPII